MDYGKRGELRLFYMAPALTRPVLGFSTSEAQSRSSTLP